MLLKPYERNKSKLLILSFRASEIGKQFFDFFAPPLDEILATALIHGNTNCTHFIKLLFFVGAMLYKTHDFW